MDDLLKAPLWQKALAVIMAVLFVLWGLNTYFWSPKIREINSLKGTLKSVEYEIELIAPKEEIIKKGMDISALVRAELASLMKKIPTEAEVPFIIDELISQVGAGLNISYELIKPEPIMAEDKYSRLPLSINFYSDFTDLNLYLKQLKKLPTTIRIDSMLLDKTVTPPKLRVGMLLSAFVMPGPPIEPREQGEVSRKPYLFDPFYRPTEADLKGRVKKRPMLELQGVWKGKSIKAIINDKVVEVGDAVEGYKVIDIGQNEVTVFKDGNKTVLTIEGGK